MGEVHQLRARAERSRRAAYALPVVADVADAKALAQRIASQLAAATDRDALLCLALLQDVETVLARRVARLEAEMAQARDELARARENVAACNRYGATASLVIRRPETGA